MTILEELKKHQFDGCDIHSFDGIVVAMSDVEKVVDELTTQIQELLDARPELTTSIEPFDADWMDHKSHLKLALEHNRDFIKWYNTMKSVVLGLLGVKESKTQ